MKEQQKKDLSEFVRKYRNFSLSTGFNNTKMTNSKRPSKVLGEMADTISETKDPKGNKMEADEVNRKKSPIRIHGVRICQHCRGICHRVSWRQKHGQRRRYWCSLLHLWTDKSYLKDDTELLEFLYEPVIVITS